MSYSLQRVEAKKALEHREEYAYALVCMMSQLLLCKTSELPELDWDECMEARFFDRQKELHIYKEDGELHAVEVIEEGQEDCIVRRYQLANRFRGAGRLLRVHEYLGYDEDGQAVVSLTRLAGIEEV